MRYIFSPLYHIWFYFLVFITTVVLSPFLLFTTIKESWYSHFYKVAKIWSTLILFGMGAFPSVKNKVDLQKGQSYMFIANHTSMLDIMMMYYCIPIPFVFVGKEELAKIPIFGFFYKRTSILVNRSNLRSKKAVMGQAHKRIENGLGICIFPEGGVPKDTNIVLDRFKDGAFRLAIEHQIPIAALVFYDNGTCFPYSLFNGYPKRLRAEMLPVMETKHLKLEDKNKLRDDFRNQILQKLN